MQKSVTLAPTVRPKRLRWTPPLNQVLPFVIPLLVVVGWQFSSRIGWLPSSVLPSPWAVF